METLYVKVISVGVIFTVTFLGGCLPFLILRKFLQNKANTDEKLSFLRCLAAGIFVGTCLLHLLPEAQSSMASAFPNVNYPVAEACAGIGFLLMFTTENFLMACRKQNDDEDEDEKKSQERDKKTINPTVTYNRYGSLEDSEASSDGVSTSFGQTKNGRLYPTVDDTIDSVKAPLLDVDLEDRTESSNASINCENEVNPKSSKYFRSFVLLIALSLHTIFDGLVIGIQTSEALAWTLLVAMSIHKCLVAFSLGLTFLDSHAAKPRQAVMYLLFFSLVAPIGAGIGTALTEARFSGRTRSLTSGFLQSIATGTFMFITFCECLKEDLSGKRQLLKVLFVIIGYAAVAGIRFAINDG